MLHSVSGAVCLSTPLFDVPPSLIEEFCKILDCSDGRLGWRGLAPTVNLHQDDSAIQLTDPKVIAEATQNFHSDQKIGEGMFSEIYKGVIQNKLFAIKVLKQEKQSDWKKLWQVFLSEVEVLLMYRHPHILELVGYCSDEERYCLVYPFMQNGSLHTKLQCKDKTMGLPWQLRLNIIKGIAKAVHFLHTAQPCSVICGNITSANILLNEYFEPKLTDFALARLRPHTANQSCTITLDSDTRQMMGYWPEEYIRDGKLSVKLDVFSFGVVSKALEELSIMCYETDDQPRTLKETVSPVSTDLHRRHPVENDEIQDSPLKWAGPNKPPPNQHIQGRERSVPCECSQSEVTFIGITGCQNATPSKSPLNVCVVGQDEKNSWLPKSFQNVWGPVECSCTAENSSDCEYSMVVENTAKVKFMNKIQRYKQGELTSEELLSITPVYQVFSLDSVLGLADWISAFRYTKRKTASLNSPKRECLISFLVSEILEESKGFALNGGGQVSMVKCTVEGYILPRRDDEKFESLSDEEENSDLEDNDPEFLDLQDVTRMSSGGMLFKGSLPPFKKVFFQDLKSNKKHFFVGRLPLTDPWWKITVLVRSKESLYSADGYPFYALRTQLGSESKSLMSLFLTSCQVPSENVAIFCQWLFGGKQKEIEFDNLPSILEKFSKEKLDHADEIAEDIMKRINSMASGKAVQVAARFPLIIYYLPNLLPREFVNSILTYSKEDEESCFLEKLDTILKENVWKLGFRNMTYRELNLVSCEVSLEAFKRCNLLESIPELQCNSLMVYDALKQTCRQNGHTYVWMNNLTKSLKMIPDDKVWDAIKFLKDNGVVMQKSKRIMPWNLHLCEQSIVKSVEQLVNAPSWCIELDVKKVLQEAQYQRHTGTSDLDPDQVKAAEMMCANPVTVISGKGGCGKTTVVSLIFQEAAKNELNNEEAELPFLDLMNGENSLMEEEILVLDGKNQPKVLLTAPTGKAASLLKKRTGFDAFTLHQVYWSFMTEKKKDVNLSKWKFAKVQVLVVDEGSLVSVYMLSSVLSVLTQHAELKKLVILGDIRQLPSIDPGNTLVDMFNGFSKIGWAVEMRTNHRAESQLIVENAGRISDMGMKGCWNPLDFDLIVSPDKNGLSPISPDCKFIFVSLPGHCADEATLKQLRSSKNISERQILQMKIDCKMLLITLLEKLLKKAPVHHTLVRSMKNHKNKQLFQKGDKVCCTRNGYVLECTLERDLGMKCVSASKSVRVCNGEIFFIIQDEEKDKTRYLTLDDKEDHQICVRYKELKKECKPMHAWARTIHTFQGSEAETVVYVTGPSGRQNWQHLYTAITRGRKRVYVVAKESDLITIAQRKSTKRQTSLQEILCDKIRHRTPAADEMTASHHKEKSQGASLTTGTVSQQPPRDLAAEHVGATSSPVQGQDAEKMWLLDDMSFLETYSWSPMESTRTDENEMNSSSYTIDPEAGHLQRPTVTEGSSPSIKRSSHGSGVPSAKLQSPKPVLAKPSSKGKGQATV
ncbi:HELB helicase, partial [Polypterus senegalus]